MPMDNFRTVSAVLVVLLAFTGLQLVANYALRRAVREDVKQQVAETQNTRAEMLEHHRRLKEAADLLGGLNTSLDTVRTRMAALETTLGTLGKAVEALGAKLREAAADAEGVDAKIEASAKRLRDIQAAAGTLQEQVGRIGGLAREAGLAQGTLKTLQKQVGEAEGRAKSADVDAQRALTQIISLKTEFANHKRSVDDLRLDEMKRGVETLQNDLTRLTRAVDTLRLKN